MRKLKKCLTLLMTFVLLMSTGLPVRAANIENLSLETGESITVSVPYYEDSYEVVNGVEPVLFESSNPNVATASKTGISMGSNGNSLSVEILGRTEGNADITISMRESGEILAQYAVTVTKSDATTLRLCKDEHTTISFDYSTKKFSYKVNDSSANLTVHKTSTSQSSINGNYKSSTKMELSFGTIGEYILTIYDENDNIIIEYNAIITDHTWSNEYTVDKEPTCIETGVKSRHCTKCNATTDEIVIETVDYHTWANDYTVDKEPTCTEKGQKSIHCSICDVIKEDSIEEIEMIDHDWDNTYTVDKFGSCTEDEQTSIHCKVCNAIKEDSITIKKATGHKWDSGVTIKEATCTEDGKIKYTCEVCSETNIKTIEGKHTWNKEYTIDEEPTCITSGRKSIYCSVCGDVDKDSIVILPATGHDYGDWEVIEEPTTESEGTQRKVCKTCGSDVIETIPQITGEWKHNSRGMNMQMEVIQRAVGRKLMDTGTTLMKKGIE